MTNRKKSPKKEWKNICYYWSRGRLKWNKDLYLPKFYGGDMLIKSSTCYPTAVHFLWVRRGLDSRGPEHPHAARGSNWLKWLYAFFVRNVLLIWNIVVFLSISFVHHSVQFVRFDLMLVKNGKKMSQNATGLSLLKFWLHALKWRRKIDREKKDDKRNLFVIIIISGDIIWFAWSTYFSFLFNCNLIVTLWVNNIGAMFTVL